MKIQIHTIADGHIIITTRDLMTAEYQRYLGRDPWVLASHLDIAYVVLRDRPLLRKALLAEGFEIDEVP